MTAVFRSCLPRFYSDTNQSLSNEHLSTKTPSVVSFNNEPMEGNPVEYISNTTNHRMITSQTTTSAQFDIHSRKKPVIKEGLERKQAQQVDVLLPSEQTKRVRSKRKNTKIAKKRGPRYSRINEKASPLLTRLVDTIFGDQGSNNHNNNNSSRHVHQREHMKRPLKKNILPSKSTMKKQFEDNEQTLRSLVTLLTQIESNVKLTTTKTPSTITISNDKASAEREQSRNNNRMDDTPSSHSSDSYYLKSRVKSNRQPSPVSKRYTNTRSMKNSHLDSKTRQSEEEETICSSCSTTSHYSSQHSPLIRRKMIDNQQQTQLYVAKNSIGSMTQTNERLSSELSWLDVMREDQTTINAWARIRRRLKPNQQKDILRALMIICANLFEVPMENKHM